MQNQLDIISRLELKVQYLKFKRDKQNSTLFLESDHKDVRILMDLFSKVLNQGLKNYPNYWLLLCDYLSNRSTIKFILQLEFLQNEGEKAFLWLVLEFCNKQLKNLFFEIYSNQEIQEEYDEQSYIKYNKEQLLSICDLLQELDYQVNSSLIQHYQQYLQLEQEIEKEIQQQEQQDPHTDSHGKSFSGKQSMLNQSSIQKDVESFRESLYNKQQEEENHQLEQDKEEEEEEERLLTEIQNKQSSLYNNNTQSGALLQKNQQFDQKEQRQTFIAQQRQSSKIDFDEFLKYRETRKSENQMFKELYGSPSQNQNITPYLDNVQIQNPYMDGPKETCNDQGYYGKKKSQILYDRDFKNMNLNLTYRQKKEKPLTLQEQLNKCYECKQQISQGIYILCNTAHFCHYNQAYVCDNCISTEKRLIPWKVLENFDCKSYKVSKESKKELDYLYDKPINQFEYKDDIVQKHEKMYEFMILKRSLHLLFDMICNHYIVLDVLQDNKNMLLKINLFSLKNFYEISNGSLETKLQKKYKLLKNHVWGCAKCLKNGFQCKICQSERKLFNFDIKNTSVCDNCTSIYHNYCLEVNSCFKCAVEY